MVLGGMKMDILLTIVITALISISGTWIAKDIVKLNKPAKTVIINNDTRQETSVQTFVDTKAIASTAIYQGLSNQEFLCAITNMIAKSNTIKDVITNTNWRTSTTNYR